MSRSISQRLLVIALLICKLVAGELMSVSMAEAAMVQPDVGATAQSAPCPAHQHGLSAKTESASSDQIEPHHHSGFCKHGCKCPCAHTPASAMPTLFAGLSVPAHDVPALYVAPSIGESATALFRPPI